MPPSVLPVWESFLASGDTCFVEIDPTLPGAVDLVVAQIPDSTHQVIVSIRCTGELMWMPKAAAHASEVLVVALDAIRGKGMAVSICPAANGFPSDIPSTLAFLRTHQASDVGLVVEPAALLTPDLLKAAADHVARVRESLLVHPQLRGVILSNISWDTAGTPKRTSLAGGAVPEGLIAGLTKGLPPDLTVFAVG